MAEKVKLQSLQCSICHDVFKAPTLLNCGHSFCKVCLDGYDEQHRGHNFMHCPLCRKRTKLKQQRVAGLAPNFSLTDVEEELNLKFNGKSSEYCSLHSEVFKDILCEVCKKCICMICFLDKHQGHTFKKKEAVVAELKKKGNSIIRRSDVKKGEIKESITNAVHHKRDMHSHLENVDREIETSFRKMLKILRENKQRLLKETDDIRKNSGKVLTDSIECQELLLQSISEKSSLMGQEDIAGTSTDALPTLYIGFQSLKEELEKDLNVVEVFLVDPSIAHALREVDNTRFCPSDGIDLGAVGHDTNESENDLDQGSLDQDASENELDEGSLDQEASESENDSDQSVQEASESESEDDLDLGTLGQEASESEDDLHLSILGQDANESEDDSDQSVQEASESEDDLDLGTLGHDANESEDNLYQGTLDQEASESENDSDQSVLEASASEDDLDEEYLDLEVSKSQNDLDEDYPRVLICPE